MRALNRPTSWWGWNWEQPIPMSIIELIEAGNMDSRVAALFWVAMERGASLIIAADPPHSGKTTTLSALMSFTHPDTLVYFTCGEGEPFALPVTSEAHHTYILINEMSNHIPVYTWDDNARRAFELLSEGYRMGTTMHDTTTEGVLAQLENDLGVPKEHLAHLTFIVPMYIGRGGRGIIRRVIEIAQVERNGRGYKLSRLVEWQPETDSFSLFVDKSARDAFAAWARLTPADLESLIEERAGFLDALRGTGIREIPQVGAAIEAWYEQMPGAPDARA
jgi:hypothetical protein